MKVITAGFPKTGTKSMANALKILGYDVYDYMEHFWYHGKEWNKILTTGGTADDFKRMYENVDAIIDTPVFFFWEQIYQAFPDALIILTTRDQESWMNSCEKQVKKLNSDVQLRFMWAIWPIGWAFQKHFNTCTMALFGSTLPHIWSQYPINHTMMLNRYKMHNEYVKKHAPKDKLLVFDVRNGWEPLCKFLGKDVPEVPFPHKNIGGTAIKMLLKENACMQALSRHAMVASAVWMCVGGVVIFFLGRIVMRMWGIFS